PEEITLEKLRADFPAAALVWAHPFRNGKCPAQDELMNPLLDAIEIFNINHTPKENYQALVLWHKYKFNAVAGTDAHDEQDVGLFSTQVLHPITSIAEFSAEVKKGRTIPFVKEIPRAGSNLVVTEITMGTKGGDEKRNRLITKQFTDDKKWQAAKRSQALREAILAQGFDSGKYRVPRTLDINEPDRLIIEEGQRGEIFFDTLAYVDPAIGSVYFKLSAEWLAKLHSLKLVTEGYENTLEREEHRAKNYLKSFQSTGNPYRSEAEKYIDFVLDKERGLFPGDLSRLVLCHGDYHPRNIIIGQDRARDIGTLYVSVIDFDNAIFMPPEFDLGYFISQFLHQFHGVGQVFSKYRYEDFLTAYLKFAKGKIKVQEQLINLFRLRANLSIASFLIKVGKGESPEMALLMKDSHKLYHQEAK
ncbi:MAG: phosphotransferase, partial [bacterium]|nr:phosphotransferase [bacterium]